MRLTSEQLREALSYDRESGVFTRKVSSQKRLIGKEAGRIDHQGYRQIRILGNVYGAHRLAWLYIYNEWPPSGIDHKDTCRDHNWIDNLRPATASQNAANIKSRHSLNVILPKGVTLHRCGRYQAQIKKDSINFYLGLFDDPQEAHMAYMAKAKELFGEFARAA